HFKRPRLYASLASVGTRAAQGNFRVRLVALRDRTEPPRARGPTSLPSRTRSVKKAVESRRYFCAERSRRIQALKIHETAVNRTGAGCCALTPSRARRPL